MTYIEAAVHRALIRASRKVDLTTNEAVPVLLRELSAERLYLKERPERRLAQRTGKP